MTNSEIDGTPSEDLDAANLDNIQEDLFVQKFYNPLCVTGYLTPLQRKKLREKRSDFSIDSKETRERENKRTRAVKRKKRTDTVLRDRSKDQIKRMKTKENISQLQYSISKIVHSKSDNIKTKKFFKSSTSDRLNKANFKMPLVLKKNMFLNIDRSVKECLAHTKKLSQHKNKKSHSLLKDFNHAKHSELKNIAVLHSKENLEDDIGNLQMSANSNILGQTPTNLPQQENVEHISVSGGEKSIFEFNWPSDEELLKRCEKARELNKKNNRLRDASKFTDVGNENQEQSAGSQVKFYPIFHFPLKKQLRNNETKSRESINDVITKQHTPKHGVSRIKKNFNKKIKAFNNSEQMFIDAGQKEIGPKICSICNMIYTVGQEEDERLHSNYHDMHVSNLKFPGWKEENVIGEYPDGRVILIWNSDKGFKLKKVEDVLQVANRDLGFSSSVVPLKPDLAFLLFISNDKMIAGCVVAEPISKAFQVLLTSSGSVQNSTKDERTDNWCSSSEAVPAVCGVNRIWVAHNFRRRKVASRLIDCLRCQFIHGHVVGIREIAFTDPSPAGRQFATAYTGTSNFLVYK